jgi:hypothetical protein
MNVRRRIRDLPRADWGEPIAVPATWEPLPYQPASRSATMTVPLLTLMVLILAFGAEVGWLCRA